MKKTLSLLLTVIMLVSVVCVVPIHSSAEPLNNDEVENYYNLYWNDKYEPENFEKIGDWYYLLRRNTNGDVVFASVCGYGGNETEITIPTKLGDAEIDEIYFFAMVSDTVKKLNIPKEIRKIVYEKENSDGPNPVFARVSQNLEEIFVDPKNGIYTSQDGVLMNEHNAFDVILFLFPPNSPIKRYGVPFWINTIADCAFKDAKNLKALTISRWIKKVGIDAIPVSNPDIENSGLEELYFKNGFLTPEDFKNSDGEISVPKEKYGTIACVGETPMHDYYKNLENSEDYYTALETLPQLPDRISLSNNSPGYVYFKNDVRSYETKLVMYRKKWFYIKDGTWTRITGLIKYNGVWFYIKNGYWAQSYNGLSKYEGQWFFINNGKWRKNDNTLYKKNGKWLAIKNSKWYKGKAIISYKGKKFYVNNGFAQLGFSGKVKIGDKTYTIKSGKVK